jgi:hypothetical protein
MTYPEACTERGLDRDKKKEKFIWEANGCAKGHFQKQKLLQGLP